MTFNSLGARLFLTSTIIALIVLLLTAWQLISQYQSRIEYNFDERLKANLSLLIESSLQENFEVPKQPKQFGGFAFTLLNSGWYWQIQPLDNPSLSTFTSVSLGEEVLSLTNKQEVSEEQDGTSKFYVNHQNDRRLRVIERLITLGSNEKPQTFAYIVTGDSSEIEDDVIDFASMLGLSFLILGSGLILATILQVKVGLQPLKVVEQGLAQVRAGKTDRLEGQFPSEIEPLQTEINNLIKSNMTIIERARTHVGNLAHALKTPLSVINNEVDGKNDGFARKIGEQASLMQTQIHHHLDRARMAARVGIVGNVTEIHPIMKSLERALGKIYQEKHISFELKCPETAKFAGEQQDFEEMIGNLLDNAFKWANNEVSCIVEYKGYLSSKSMTNQSKAENLLQVVIEDDGPGLSTEEQKQVRERGRRLDETVPGSGLGLAIVTDLVDLYGGSFELGSSQMGGLKVKLQLPAGT